jgi:hypothetical protein
MSKIIRIICVLSLLCNVVHAQQFKLKLNHANGIYQNHETIVVSVLTNHWNGDTLVVKVWKNNDQLYSKTSLIPSPDSCTVFSGQMSEPCALRIDAERKNDKQLIGLIVDPLKIKPGSPCPSDFEQYWKQEKQALKSLKMDVKSNEADSKEKGILCFDTEINCIGPKPVRGYFARPASAKAKSLPIVLLVHAAGVKGYWCRSEISNAVAYAKKGALCFDLNAHGMLGTFVNRKGGWPQPFEQKGNLEKMKNVMPYFDTANLLKLSKATIVAEIGLVDQICPSTSIYAAINQVKGKKIIYPVIYREHTWPNEQQRKEWDMKVFNPKNEFIDDYLK